MHHVQYKKTILKEVDMYDAHIPFLHPTMSYLRFVRDHASNDFAALQEEAKGNQRKLMYLRKKACKKIRRHLRVQSADKAHKMKEWHFDLKPKTAEELQQAAIIQMLNVRIVDMGNACYIDNHFAEFITTRYYRAPEVIMGGKYDEKADIWSFACLIFEMVTSDVLFRPKSKEKGGTKEEDHILLI